MAGKTTTTLAKPEAPLLPVPADLLARGEAFVALLETGADTRKALADANLTPQQASFVLARRPLLKARAESMRETDAIRHGLYSNEAEELAMARIRSDVVVEETVEVEDGPDGETRKTKTVTKPVSHDKLHERMLDLHADFRKARAGEDKGGAGQLVAIAVHIHGVDMAAMARGNSAVVEGSTEAALDAAKRRQAKDRDGVPVDVEVVP